MKLNTELYVTAKERWPDSGQQVIGYQEGENIVVYQAYNSSIANYAVAHQQLGGNSFSYNRMSWIKPNFLWMMYRCGWAEKENQERVLALWLSKKHLELILEQAVFSTFGNGRYESHEAWKQALATKEVRLQWDPDHDPYGQKLNRRAIQLGLKGDILESFGKEMVSKIEDITDFVKAQKQYVNNRRLDMLQVPVEQVFEIQNQELCKRIGIVGAV
ncbi:protein of unknown function [Filimonas lacunae]|uniref:DUF4291 domain-containing protein n=1 Tax=Filimonas lacunae TaxID=477680 RepID=A0A173MDK7_9BACT|nr:DUF4291 domain-containing protein [Filimonas lacunae]BAV05610.1 hypothetical protein FLA_1621 [Filimonas lacunae]SIT29204.1 protein of unknown function [Filimonas lacunae]